MLRICLIIAIVAGLAAAVLSFTKVQEIITTTRADRDKWHTADDQEVAAHNKTKKDLATTKATLATTEKNLAQTKNELEAANGKVDELTKNNTDLTAKLDKATADRDDAQQQLERWREFGMTPDQVKDKMTELAKTIKARDALIGENKLLLTKYNDLNDQWQRYVGTNDDVVLPTGLRGKIVAVDPKFNFVVLNIGEDQGAKARGVMMVDRAGKLLGKVRITNVKKDECVANILPDWRRGEIMEGDEVLY